MSSNYAKKNMMNKEGNINFYKLIIKFYKFSVTDGMGDLISRKAVMRKLFFTEDGRKYPTRDIDNFPVTVSLENLRKIIRNVPTAYDVDKVVEQLKECERYIYDAVSDEDNYVIDTEKAIEIVKGAVKDE